ncbi:hypothetical protein ACIQMJ_26425 [Actinosynnema sp. NPDC091369]
MPATTHAVIDGPAAARPVPPVGHDVTEPLMAGVRGVDHRVAA